MALGFGFNKVKVLASAEKFVQQGKLQNAIAEYEKVAREDPKDLTVLNTIGDLYARVGQNEHAVHYFKKVGDQYAQNGFTVKAIAIYKKLSKLAPNNTEHITRLAELFTQQGLFSDARAQYMLMADAYIRSGDTSQAARVFQRILELDPENAATQAKLADMYMKLGKKEDALKIYSSAAEALYVRGSYEAAAEALGKVITLDPNNAGALLLRGLIAAGSGDNLSAIHHLEQVPDLDAHPEALKAAVNSRLQSGNVDGVEELAQKLAARYNDVSALSGVADWYVKHGRISSAVKLYENNADKLFSGGSGLQETLFPLIEKAKDDPQALNTLQHLIQGGGQSQQSAEMLELQAHASVQKGDYANARDLYKKLTEVEPENALHNQNYRQMLAKLGEDSATRILTPEEAAQAFMVEELDQGAAVVRQKYDPPTETAIESALTDAELYVSYNVPSKAIAPLEAALPLAPKDVTLNQRLATLYARAERFGDAARVCQNLSEIYRELGYGNEAARYQEAARKYGVRAGVGQNVAAAMRNLEPLAPVTERPQQNVATSSPAQASIAPVEEAAPSVQEFSFDVPEHLSAEPEVSASVPEITLEPAAPQEFDLQVSPVAMTPEAIKIEPEADGSNEWEEMLSVEVEDGESSAVEITAAPSEAIAQAEAHDAQKVELEPIAHAQGAAEPVSTHEEPQEGGTDVCYREDDKVQEIQFFISQQMWQAANKALNELTEIAPDSKHLPELMAAISAAKSKSASSPVAEPAAAVALEQTVADFLPPPFAAPVPHTTLDIPVEQPAPVPPVATAAPPATPVPAAAPAKIPVRHKEPVLHEESILELEEEIAPPPAKSVPVPKAHVEPAAASAQSTEDILTDFVQDLESTDLKDFVPKPQREDTAAVAMAMPTAATPKAGVSPAARTNGSAQAEEASSVLADILSDLQEETAEAAEPEEDPETHYNLGIAFKEMGLLDEAIGELQKVCRAIDGGRSFSQPIQAYTWLAQCLVDKGAPEAAVRWYQKALQLQGLDDSSRCAIYYDLAAAYEAFGDKKSALANFMEVYGSNIDFRDVASRIKVLKS